MYLLPHLPFLFLVGRTLVQAGSFVPRNNETKRAVMFGPNTAYVPAAWHNVIAAKNFNRNVSVAMWQTTLEEPDKTCEEGFAKMANMSFITFDESFYKLLGVDNHMAPKAVEKLFDFPDPPSFAKRMVHDATAYSPEANAIFFAELHVPNSGFSADSMPWVWRTSLDNSSNPKTEKVYPKPQLTMPNGAYYYGGSIYWVQEGNTTVPPAVVRMDPQTLETEVVLNNFYGHRFNSLNDIAITKDGVAFFTDFYGNATFNTTLDPMITNNIYRWELATGNLKVVAGAGDSMWLNPNGVALSPQHNLIYFSNRGNTGDDAWGSRTIYSYGIDNTNKLLTDRNIFAYVDSGIVDGMKTDSEGNVYAAVTGGVDVFNPQGVLLGKIKTGAGMGDVAVNMAWAGHWLYIFGRASIYRVELTTTESLVYA